MLYLVLAFVFYLYKLRHVRKWDEYVTVILEELDKKPEYFKTKK